MLKSLFFIVFLSLFAVCLIPAGTVNAAGQDILPADTRCPVCGMFVAKYPNWLAGVHYRSPDSTQFFDGVKDMMAFYFNPEKFGGGPRDAISEISVKDYYTLKWLDGREAFYVIGSDVYGPMGHELIPFASQESAESFKKDHDGKKVILFEEIRPELIESLRQNQKMR